MLEKIVIFILFLTPLIFFHELGHFLFARLFGVRVEVFSIGFGPKFFKWKPGETEYTLSAIPLGGYIKMFGDDPLGKDKIPLEERRYSFNHQGKWGRFWIVMGGPLANFILTYVIFFGLISFGEKVPEIKLGVVPPKSIFYDNGLRSGDIIKKFNDVIVSHPSDLPTPGDDPIGHMSVLRFGKVVHLKTQISAKDFFEEFKEHSPFLRKPFVVNAKGEQFMLSPSSEKADSGISLEEWGHYQDGQNIYFFKMVQGKEESELIPEKTPTFSFEKSFQNFEGFMAWLSQKQMRPLELAIKSIRMNGPADKAGLVEGDVITTLNGKDIFTFQKLREMLQDSTQESIRLGVWKGGKFEVSEIKPKKDEVDGKSVRIIGIFSAVEYIRPKFVQVDGKGLGTSAIMAFGRTWDSITKMVAGVKKLIVRDVSFDQVGGPLRIGKVASDSFNISISYFLQLMALISANLGIINLLPIPILDGGHIMFIFLELVNRGPLSRRKIEIAQQVGLSLLLLLMMGAMFNDFSWILSN